VRRHPHRQELLLAAREHDNGWREADAAPRVDPISGRPLDFRDLTSADRIEIWRRGVRRFGKERPLVALLILHHARQIHNDDWQRADWMEFGDEIEELRLDLEDASGIETSTVAAAHRFLELADLLSLGACGALGAGVSRHLSGGYRFEAELGRIALDPFPLAGATSLDVAYRSLPGQARDGAAGLAVELAEARWRRLPVHVEPLHEESVS
jgi:hypothetical protein